MASPASSENATAVYAAAESYWKGISPDIDGMLGGFAHLSDQDTKDSKHFLERLLQQHQIKKELALDCGAGIGRVSKHLLLDIFDQVDMVDVTDTFLNASVEYMGPELNSRVRKRICRGLQEFSPDPATYNVIWIQWVAGHLSDNDLVDFLKRCRTGITSPGLLVVKENMASNPSGDFDEVDNSWTRSRQLWLKTFKEAGLTILKETKQRNFPQGVYQVRMFALM